MNIKVKAALKVAKLAVAALSVSVLVNFAIMYVPVNYLVATMFVCIMGYLTRSLYLVYLSQFQAQERAKENETK